MPARTQANNPYYESSGTVLTTATWTSGEFYLRGSEFFSIEWDLESGSYNGTGITAKLQMKSGDGTWVDAREADTTNGSDKSKIVTAETSLARGWTTITPPYSRRAFRIHLTNNCTGSVTVGFYVHMSNSRLT